MNKAINFLKDFGQAGVFFPAANVCNFMQANIPAATVLAGINLAYSAVAVGAASANKNMPEDSSARKFIERAFHITTMETFTPLRVTSYCALAVGAVLLVAAAGGAGAALFPGLAAMCFGVGNFIQSNSKLDHFRASENTSPLLKAVLHPSIWFGLGYAMTGINIGGGLALLSHPLGNLLASALTLIGIAETAGSIGLMVSSKVTNQAAPFIGVAGGTLFFAAAGLVTGNWLGAATGLFACAGEISLAIAMQKKHNTETLKSKQKSSSKIEDILTAPVRGAMRLGWVKSTEPVS